MTGDDGGGDVGGGSDGGVEGSGDGGGVDGGGGLGDGGGGLGGGVDGGGLLSVRSNDGADGQNEMAGVAMAAAATKSSLYRSCRRPGPVARVAAETTALQIASQNQAKSPDSHRPSV